MPFKVTNPEYPPPHSPSSSSSSHPMPPDRASLHSSVSSSDHTAFSAPEPKISLDDVLPGYIDSGLVPPPEKGLPPLPRYEKQKSREDYDPYAGGCLKLTFLPLPLLPALPADPGQSSSSSHTHVYPLTTVGQLATALGPDNAPHTTEIETIPCSGVRIPFGPLKGLLAWRLVVRVPSPSSTKGKGRRWNARARKDHRRNSYHTDDPSNPMPPSKSASYSDSPMLEKRLSSKSTASLPMSYSRKLTSTPEPIPRPPVQGYPSITPSRYVAHVHSYSYSHPHPDPVQKSTHEVFPSDAVATNFILDTSLSYSIISRDTLIALGYPAHRFPAPALSNPHSPHWDDHNAESISVTLSVQNVLTKLRIARPGEASRLGVQYLHDAGVSVFFPRNGDGVGPVLYLESARLLKDVPRTITSLPGGHRGVGMPKITLQQRVRALFGLG
ncbi:hypothetical protein JR316_0000536 [Psilocybe cubensis]|uniref:Uncharacterized protein n=2 Tax=Psilocybe cubensis TaxID=181762 RepID=A0A8H7Y9N7_PSICU|nr:hypothetical protein JR316_0000536 [Psilocybe cubensis]KAH9486471.1 hypothetical protein JR316_0000536 [Psilocybe cubensis]